MQAELITLLKETGALITNSHFVGVSGRHMDTYVNKDALLTHPRAAARVGEMLAVLNKDRDIEAVIAPAMGAIILGHWTAFYLSQLTGREILSVYTDKGDGDTQVLKRGYDKVIAGKKVLAIEDVTTTGGSIRKSIEKAQEAGAIVVQASVMINKAPESVTTNSIGVSFDAIAAMAVASYAEEECPLCKEEVPVNTTVGHGKKFLESKK